MRSKLGHKNGGSGMRHYDPSARKPYISNNARLRWFMISPRFRPNTEPSNTRPAARQDLRYSLDQTRSTICPRTHANAFDGCGRTLIGKHHIARPRHDFKESPCNYAAIEICRQAERGRCVLSFKADGKLACVWGLCRRDIDRIETYGKARCYQRWTTPSRLGT